MDAVIYARLSTEDLRDNPASGLTATERQLRDCRDHAAANDVRIVGTYVDDGIPASDPKRKRPAFERMLRDLDVADAPRTILAWKFDRLLRRPAEAERVLALADARDLTLVSLNDPRLDLASPTGRAMFRMTITWAALETDTLKLRVRRKMRDLAEAGHPNGGGVRPFGLRGFAAVRDPVTQRVIQPYHYEVVPEEAALVREAADRILAGESVHSVVRDWDLRGIRTPGHSRAPEGRRWEVSSLKRMLIAPRIVGDRLHRGTVITSDRIPAMLDRETGERLRAILAVARGRPTSVRSYYLTGIATCGRCGAKLSAQRTSGGVRRYACRRGRQGCGQLVIAAHYIEPLIAEAIAQRLDSDEFREAVTDVAARTERAVDLDRLRADQEALEETSRLFLVERVISKAEFLKVRAELESRIATTTRRLDEAAGGSSIAAIAGMDVRGRWEHETVEWRHEVAAAMIDRMVVKPAPRRGTRFDPSRIDVEWRQ